jgi:CBS domain-containing protein
MTTNVRYAKPEHAVEACLRLMTERYFRHLPVLDEQGKILGIVSIGDLVKARLTEQEFVIGQMENYIADSLPVQR